jgi:mRNA interferase MazF
VKNGDIHWVNLPGVGGREQRGRRPALIIQDEIVGERLPTVLVVPLTSSRRALRFAGTTVISATAESGLRHDSVALVFQCLAIDRTRVEEPMGKASHDDRERVLRELRILTGQTE